MKNNSKKENIDVYKLYGKDSLLNTQEFIDKYKVNLSNGLSSDEALNNINK